MWQENWSHKIITLLWHKFSFLSFFPVHLNDTNEKFFEEMKRRLEMFFFLSYIKSVERDGSQIFFEYHWFEPKQICVSFWLITPSSLFFFWLKGSRGEGDGWGWQGLGERLIQIKILFYSKAGSRKWGLRWVEAFVATEGGKKNYDVTVGNVFDRSGKLGRFGMFKIFLLISDLTIISFPPPWWPWVVVYLEI